MKVLNLYAGIGGNRKLWTDVEVTAVEWDEKIAAIYQDFFPDDKVIITDAHQYLLEHFKEFDFIWSSPPCQSHSRFRNLWKGDGSKIRNINKKSGESIMFPDLKLYEEIIFLDNFFKGKYCVENVISYYNPLIIPQKINNHYFWSNFKIKRLPANTRYIRGQIEGMREKITGFNLDDIGLPKRFKRKLLNNCVEPETGLHILECAKGIIKSQDVTQKTIFY